DYDRVRPEDPLGPLARGSALSPGVSGRYYLSPLVGEPEGPLALLEFYQHPGHLQAGLEDVTRFDRVAGEWRTAQRALAVSAGGAFYPWHETGLLADVTATYAGTSSDAHSALQLD